MEATGGILNHWRQSAEVVTFTDDDGQGTMRDMGELAQLCKTLYNNRDCTDKCGEEKLAPLFNNISHRRQPLIGCWSGEGCPLCGPPGWLVSAAPDAN